MELIWNSLRLMYQAESAKVEFESGDHRNFNKPNKK